MPRRNPGLIQRVAAAFFRDQPGMGPQDGQRQTTASGVVSQSQQLVYDKYFSSKNDRMSIYADVDQLDDTSEEVSVALDTIADNAATSEEGSDKSFVINCKDPDASGAMLEVIERCDLHNMVYSIARNTLKYGDVFLEIIVNKEKKIIGVKLLPPNTMYRNEDTRGVLAAGEPLYDENDGTCLNESGECAFEQQDPDTKQIIAAFFPWQIVHGRWNYNGFSTYGDSMLRVTRIIAKKLRAEEESLIMGRLVRAMLKLVFYIDTTGLSGKDKAAAVENFKQSILTRASLDGKRENPYYVLTDFFLSDGHYRVGGEVRASRTRVETLDPKNEGLNQIEDIKYFHRKKLATLRVPPAYMGFEEEINAKATLSMQDIEYVRFVRRLQQYLGHLLKDVFSIQHILDGRDPSDIDYSISWPSLQREDEAAASLTMLQQAQAAAILVGGSARINDVPIVDPEFIQREILGLNDDEIEQLNARLDKFKKGHIKDTADREGAVTKAKTDNSPEPAPPKPVVVAPNGQPVVSAANRQRAANNEKDSQKNGQPVPSNKTPVRQEMVLLAERIRRVVDQEVAPDINRIFGEQKATLENTRKLHDELQGENNGRE